MEAEADHHMFKCLIEKHDGQFNYSNVITHYNLKMGQETYLN
ncbi:toxin [Enterococcus faecalis]|nr:toxin [Enterococcus faecalis]OSH45577.1 toxin [Enterococcus faecalis]